MPIHLYLSTAAKHRLTIAVSVFVSAFTAQLVALGGSYTLKTVVAAAAAAGGSLAHWGLGQLPTLASPAALPPRPAAVPTATPAADVTAAAK